MNDVHADEESHRRSGAVAASLLMLGAMTLGVIEVAQRNPTLMSSRAWLEIAAVVAVSFALGFAARFVTRAIVRRRVRRAA